ncbi:BTAD domain-containing putative transcriptional regulator [Nodosilinea sp. FACHB-13]|uniref:WD40 domain-containing protein n=1 Tax=Cyanophyceae TaxID=3028117 RepID=UPI001683DCD3|nr:NACHT domain-containing protein [Nodosilinea sp. FACHB-13]
MKSPLSSRPAIDWGEAPDVSVFFGREVEIATLSRWVVDDGCRLVAVLGMGGIGKTTLTAKLVETLVDLPQAPFERIIWRSLRHAPRLDELLEDLVGFVSDQHDTRGTLKQLLYWLRQTRCLLLLDNMETLLHEGERAGYFRDGYEDYGDLLQLVAETRHQSCVVLTSREQPAVVGMLAGNELPVRSHLLTGSLEAALALCEAKGLTGSDAEKRQLTHRYGNSPLALKIVATSIQSLFDGDIAEFLAEDTVIFNGLQRLLDQQFRRLSELERTVMYWLAINRDWTSISELVADIQPPASRPQVLEVLESLRWRSLIETQSGRYSQQPVVMEYVSDQLIEQISHELASVEPVLFLRHALLKTTVNDYLRDSQRRLILQPIARQLSQTFSSESALEQQMLLLLESVRGRETQMPGYGGGNLINLCAQLGLDLAGYDFSHLSLRHACLPKAKLHRVNFTQAHFIHTVFSQTFSSILSIAYSPDRTLLAAGDSNGGLRVWRLADYQLLLTVQGHTDWAKAVAFSPDGRTLASGGDDAMIHLWDIATGQAMLTLSGHTNYVQAIAFHPQGQLASGSHDGTLKLWDTHTGNAVATLVGHSAPVRAVAFSPDGTYLASGSSDCTVKLWDAATGSCLGTLDGHRDRIWTLAWHGDSKTLASGSSDKTIRLWDVATQTGILTLYGHSQPVLAVDFSADGQLLASSSADQTIKLWEIPSGNALRTLRDHHDWVWALAFNQPQLASGGDDQTLKFWDVQTGHCLKTLRGFTNQIFAVAFHPHQPWLVSGSLDGLVRLWNWQTGETLATLSGHSLWVRATQFSPDGCTLASSSTDKTIRLWQGALAQSPRERTSQILRGHTDSVRSLAWDPTSQWLASGSADCTIRLWQVATGQCLRVLSGHTNKVRSVAWNPVQPLLASVGDDETLRLWHTETGEQMRLLQGHDKWLLTVAWHPNGRWLASGGADQTIRLWDSASGELLQVFRGHRSQVQSVVFSPVEPILASASGDSTIRLWSIETGSVLRILGGHTNQVQAVAFSADGQTLASSSNDGMIKLWRCATGEEVRSLQPERPYEGMVITGVQGLTAGQLAVLKELGAVDHASPPELPPAPPAASAQPAADSPWETAASFPSHLTGYDPTLGWRGPIAESSIIGASLTPRPSAVGGSAPILVPVTGLQIQLFDGFSLRYSGEVVAVTSERSQALLAYLVLHPQSPHRRQQMAYCLYPDLGEAQARTALRKDLYNLRQALPEPDSFLHIEAQLVQWKPGSSFSLDVAAFEAALDRAEAAPAEDRASQQHDLEAAIAHYSGALLPQLDYEWLAQARERLHQRYLEALDRLIAVLQHQQQYHQAIRYGQLLLQTDPLRESTYQALMQLHRQNGDRATAIQIYHQCMQVLQDELGLDPSADTQRIYQTLLQ